MENKYSEIEVEVAKNLLAKGYKWIARDKDDSVYAYCTRPVKGGEKWFPGDDLLLLMSGGVRGVIPIFDGIRWEDNEPVCLRDIVPQILTDEERSYIQTVIAPFREQINFVKVYYGNYYGKFIFFSVDVPEKYRVTCGPDTGYSMFIAEDSFLGMKENREYSLEELEV